MAETDGKVCAAEEAARGADSWLELCLNLNELVNKNKETQNTSVHCVGPIIATKYNKLPMPQALETAKQRLTVLPNSLKRYARETEARRKKQLNHPRCTLSGKAAI